MASHIVGAQVFPEIILRINLLMYENTKFASETARYLLDMNDVSGTGFNMKTLAPQNSVVRYMLRECLHSSEETEAQGNLLKIRE